MAAAPGVWPIFMEVSINHSRGRTSTQHRWYVVHAGFILIPNRPGSTLDVLGDVTYATEIPFTCPAFLSWLSEG